MTDRDVMLRAGKLLRKVEWSAEEVDDNCCPDCRAEEHVDGSHRPYCELALLIRAIGARARETA